MKKNILIAGLVLLNAVCLVVLLRMAWLSMLWKSEALTTSEFAANLWAANDIHKGKKVKLRLTIEKEPKGYASKPTEFDDGFVIREWVGYTDPFPLLGGPESPSIQSSRIIVESYNKRMTEYQADPEKYKQSLLKEMKYWNENVLGNKKDSNNAVNPSGGSGGF